MITEQFYQQRISMLKEALEKLASKKALLAWLRFGSIIITGIFVFLGFNYSSLSIIGAAVSLILFVRFVFADIDNNKTIAHHQQLVTINEDEIKAQHGDYLHFEDGVHHKPHDHLYANDLDIFGRASLFQYINRCTSAMGSDTLSLWLLHPVDIPTIAERQLAAKELHDKTEWRQSLQAFGKEKKIESGTYNRLKEWINEENHFINNKFWTALQVLIPVIMVTIVCLNIFDVISNPFRNIVLLASAVLAYFISKKVIPAHAQVSRIADELEVLSDSLQLIETANFSSSLLLQLQAAYKGKSTVASKEMKKLKGIVQRLDWRLNPVVFVPLAILFQWDLQQIIALEKWKIRNHKNILQWFDTLGEFEAICSLATLHFNHPEWCFPEIKEDHFFIKGEAVGHPLINAAKRVSNPVNIEAKGIVMLVTGSNMAGKSTYLRSIGINTVLAMSGAVCCAKRFGMSAVQLITSMRIADNLEESTSTFYAELKKLKIAIDKVNQHEKVFILLDEILRGTNSLDRHTGAVALTKQLIKQNAAAIIATHDVELANLKESYPCGIINYHFDVQVQHEELYFDYQLKEGICTSLNASILMKKIGIEL